MMSIDPTFVFDKTLFMENSLPCLETNRPFILGTRDQKWKATLAHRFLELLASKTNKLTRVYTQNIDGLEGQCIMLPKEKVIPVHGSMDRVACEACGAEMDFTVFCQEIKTKIKDISQMDPGAPAESSFITCATCNKAAVKPTIVLFHSRLPEEFFFSLQNDLPGVDLLLVMGTSLSVAPANQIVALVPDTTIRVVMNKEPVGYRLGIDYSESPERDYFCRGTCDEVALNLIKELGWVDDLKAMVNDLPGNSRELISKFESS
jgi:NAD-dependent SIR2 family protein deacetylase